jgi:hypothetical protein
LFSGGTGHKVRHVAETAFPPSVLASYTVPLAACAEEQVAGLSKDTHLMTNMITHACNPSYSGGRDRRITVGGQPGQKHKNLFKKKTKTKNKMVGGMPQVAQQ